jgi:hypothetical protein
MYVIRAWSNNRDVIIKAFYQKHNTAAEQCKNKKLLATRVPEVISVCAVIVLVAVSFCIPYFNYAGASSPHGHSLLVSIRLLCPSSPAHSQIQERLQGLSKQNPKHFMWP